MARKNDLKIAQMCNILLETPTKLQQITIEDPFLVKRVEKWQYDIRTVCGKFPIIHIVQSLLKYRIGVKVSII